MTCGGSAGGQSSWTQKLSGEKKESDNGGKKAGEQDDTKSASLIDKLLEKYKQRDGKQTPGRGEGDIKSPQTRKEITNLINKAVEDFVGQDLGSDADKIAKSLDMRLYSISQQYNVEIGAIISKVKDSDTLEIKSEDVYTDFHSKQVSSRQTNKYKGDVAKWHSHPGSQDFNSFSSGDIKNIIGQKTRGTIRISGTGINGYVSLPNGSIEKFDYQSYNNHIKKNFLTKYGLQREPDFSNYRQSVVNGIPGYNGQVTRPHVIKVR